jgi:hypothetical protein
MNRKTIILLVAMVATILPAVAVADVMVQGSISVESTVGSPAFFAEQGSNYAAAQALMPSGTSIWASIHYSSTEEIGTLLLPTMTNETLYAVNVLDVNFTSAINTGNFFINVTVPTGDAFNAGTYLYFSESSMTFGGISTATALSSTTTLGTSSGVYSANLGAAGTYSLEYTGVSSGTVIHVGFETSPNGLGTNPGEASIALNYID